MSINGKVCAAVVVVIVLGGAGELMMSGFYATSFDEPVEVSSAPIIIQSADDVSPPHPASAPTGAQTVAEAGATRPFVNEEQNSRSPINFPPAQNWVVTRRTEIERSTRPRFILQSGERILVQGRSEWELFSTDGNKIEKGAFYSGDIYLDPEHALFYLTNSLGLLSARSLNDGKPSYFLTQPLDEQYRLAFFARRGRKIIAVVVEERRGAHSAVEPNFSRIEVRDLGDPIGRHEIGYLTSDFMVSSLMRRTSIVITALHGETLTVATTDRVYLLDWELKVHQEMQGEFEPLAMSLDESGRIYLLVRQRGRLDSLWVLTPNGKRLMTYPLPLSLPADPGPPIVGSNHNVYLLIGKKLLAISGGGSLLWEYAITGQPGGAIVTADQQLLLADGPELAAFDENGRRSVLARFDGEILGTPPVLTPQGELLVASPRHLYVLTAR